MKILRVRFLDARSALRLSQHTSLPLMAIAAMLCLAGCDSDRTGTPSSDVIVGSRLEGVVVDYVKDGDSFVAVHQGNDIEVRLFGIDAPEKGQPYSQAARKAARTLLDRKRVTLVIQDKDRYGRQVADVYLANNPVSVNRQLVEQGAAWVYTRYSSDPVLIAAQETAQNQRQGLWALPQAERIPPWVWRESNNK